MIQKLHLGSTVAALILFFLPWIDIQCSGRSMVTQTGIQSIYGGGSLSPDLKELQNQAGGRVKDSGSQESMGAAPLVALALCAVVIGVLLSFGSLRSIEPPGQAVGMLCAIAFALLVMQMTLGFPVSRKLAEGSKKGAPKDEISAGMNAAIAASIQVRHLPSLYITLLMLGLPPLVLANGLIDKMKRGPSQ